MTETIRYGIVGVSGVGRAHANAVERAENAELIGGADLNQAAAEDFGDVRNCQWYTDAVEMIETADLDAVCVCTPSGTHADVTIQALEAGAAVLCEKPLDVYRERLDAMIEAADETGNTLGGVFQKRAYPEHQQVKKAVEDGDLGEIVLGMATVKWYRSQEYYDSGEWRGTRDLDGGCLLNQAIHQIDLLQWVLGGVSGLYAKHDTIDREMETENVAVMTLEFDDGALGTVEATTAVQGGESRLEINGTRGSYNDGTFVTADGESDIEYESVEDRQFGDAHTDVIEDFSTAVLERREPMVPAEAARDAVDIILASYESVERDEWIDIEAFRNGAYESSTEE